MNGFPSQSQELAESGTANPTHAHKAMRSASPAEYTNSASASQENTHALSAAVTRPPAVACIGVIAMDFMDSFVRPVIRIHGFSNTFPYQSIPTTIAAAAAATTAQRFSPSIVLIGKVVHKQYTSACGILHAGAVRASVECFPMTKIQLWFSIIGAVLLALTANSLSAIWASKEDRFTPWLLAVVLISPFVFITFGLVTSKIGLSMSSATVDALLTVATILTGLFLFHERDSLSLYQYSGMALAVAGIILMQFSR